VTISESLPFSRRFLVRTQIVVLVLVLVLDLLAADRLRGRERGRGRYRPFGSGCAGLGTGAPYHSENCWRYSDCACAFVRVIIVAVPSAEPKPPAPSCQTYPLKTSAASFSALSGHLRSSSWR